MEQKNIVATIYIKNGRAVPDPEHLDRSEDILQIARMYNDTGIDKIVCFDLSDDEDEKQKNLLAIRAINRTIDTKTAGGGNIRRIEDVQDFLYAGCIEVVLNGAKQNTPQILIEAAKRFGKEKMLVSMKNVDFLFKGKDIIKDTVHELFIMNESMYPGLENTTDVPYILRQDKYDLDNIVGELSSEQIRGIYGDFINDPETDIMNLKCELSDRGIKMDNFTASLQWSDMKVNSDGLVPVVTQDYRTHEVLMVAYMNEEAFNETIRIGKMTYYSRSRQELWTKGMTSGHIQYVKSLTADCDFDTILAKVSQVGVACHTGAKSCFFNNIIKKEYREKNPLSILETEYDSIVDIKKDTMDSSYTKHLFDRGMDRILKKVGEEATEMIIAAKNPGKEETKNEIADFLYDLMILMVEKEITWEDVTRELAQR
ncbi:MAG: bifunctional phosphoribosyl-AMP cyclohydrolase/phosphoribosyl-ATP diphosphatase HisIE [Lachnospiraceae bacterium]|nr:bifunctional phosphoribosyl-AMP cyclohydrolase/phosphoribosyl-ATP diphosphatase HisIE [Lachnospiraceae bacterium]